MAPYKRGAGYFLFFWKLAWIYVLQKPSAGRLVFVSLFCICVCEKHRIFKLIFLQELMWLASIWFQELSLRTDMMVDSLLHAQWRGSQCLLPCMAACLDADGWPSNKPNYFWFCMKLISMQGCWVAVCISNGFFFSSLSFSFFSPFCLPWTHLDRCQSYSR